MRRTIALLLAAGAFPACVPVVILEDTASNSAETGPDAALEDSASADNDDTSDSADEDSQDSSTSPGNPQAVEADELLDAAVSWVGDAQVLMIAEVVSADSRVIGSSPGVVQDVTLEIVQVLRDRADAGLHAGDAIFLTVPGGEFDDGIVFTSMAPFFIAGDEALFIFDLGQDDLVLARGNRSALGLRDGALVACVNPDLDAALACMDEELPFLDVPDGVPLPHSKAIQALDPVNLY